MKILILSFIFLFCFSSQLSSQSQFQRTIGGTNHDYAYSIIQTTGGGFAIAGYTYSFAAGFEDMYIAKLSGSGALQWTRTIGGAGDDQAQSIIQTSDGGFALTGYTTSFGAGNSDFYIVKLDSGGALQWNKTIGMPYYDYSFSIIQTADGGYAVAGLMVQYGAGSADMFIVKLNGNGSLQWSKTYGGPVDDDAMSIIQTTDGGYAAGGYTDSFGSTGNDYFIIKIDSVGALQWSRTIAGTGTGSEAAYSLIHTTDGGFVLAGESQSLGAGNFDMYIVKLSGSGALQWTRTLGGTSEDHGCSIVQTTNGSFTAAGFTNSFGAGNYDMYIVKLNSGGALQWSKTIGGTGEDLAQSIIKTTDGGFAAAGYTASFGTGAKDLYIVKIDSNGNTCGNSFSPTTISGTGGTLRTPTPTVIVQNPTVTTPASVTGSGGTLITHCLVGMLPISNELPSSFILSQNYPNPFNPSTKIRFEIPKTSNVKILIRDVLGSEVSRLVNEQLKPGSYEVEWDGINYASGVYFYQLLTEQFTETKRMVLIK